MPTRIADNSAPSRQRPIRILPTGRISFENQLNILRGYAAVSGVGMKPVTNDEVSKVMTSLSGSTISLANAFFADTGLILRTDQAFVPSEAVVAFSRAWEWNPKTAPHKLAATLKRSWFFDVLGPRLAFGSLSEEEAISEMATVANASVEYRGQIKTILDYLETADVIKRENGSIKLASSSAHASVNSQETQARETPTPAETREPAPRGGGMVTSFAQPTQGVINFHVDVRIDMTEFAGWPADRITAFFGGIAQVLAAKGALEKEAST